MSDDCSNYELSLRIRKLDGVFKECGTDYIQTDVTMWARKVVPRKYEIRERSGEYMVIKGIDHNPTVEEIKEIEREMKHALNKFIDEERDRFLHDVEKKLMCLSGE